MRLVGYLKPFKLGSFSCPIFKKENSYFVQEISKENEIISFNTIELSEDIFVRTNEKEKLVSQPAIFVFIDINSKVIIGESKLIENELRSTIVYNNSSYPNITNEINDLLKFNISVTVQKTPLSKKMESYNTPEKVKDLGLYPYYRTISSEQNSVVRMSGKEVLMFGSNNYLGLIIHPKLKEASKAALDKYGTGCAGSRFLNGTLELHLELEEKLAKFVGKEEALVFSTGYQVNLGVVSSLLGRHDYLILDEYDHACIIDGARLSFAKVLKYKHSDMESLEKVLKKCEPDKIKLIVTDGVFSMEGDICKLPEISQLAKKYDANIMIDDAHSIGVLGKNGRGTASHFDMADDVDLIMGTFSKSLASIGGFIASDNHTINYLKHNARSLIFSASIAPANAASVIAALDLIKTEPDRIEKLWDNTNYAIKLFKKAGFEIGNTETPIIPIYVRDDFKTFMMTKLLLEQGVFVNPVVSPAVPSSSSLLRFTVIATHTHSQIDQAIETINRAAKTVQLFDKSREMLNF